VIASNIHLSYRKVQFKYISLHDEIANSTVIETSRKNLLRLKRKLNHIVCVHNEIFFLAHACAIADIACKCPISAYVHTRELNHIPQRECKIAAAQKMAALRIGLLQRGEEAEIEIAPVVCMRSM